MCVAVELLLGAPRRLVVVTSDEVPTVGIEDVAENLKQATAERAKQQLPRGRRGPVTTRDRRARFSFPKETEHEDFTLRDVARVERHLGARPGAQRMVGDAARLEVLA